MHKRMSPHGDYDHMGESINLVNEFKVEYISQVQKYINNIDKNIKEINHNNTIEILIFKKENKYVIEYCSDKKLR